jgi:hypothetical protein
MHTTASTPAYFVVGCKNVVYYWHQVYVYTIDIYKRQTALWHVLPALLVWLVLLAPAAKKHLKSKR